MKQNEIATRTLNINTSAMKQNEIASKTLNIYTSAMKQNETTAKIGLAAQPASLNLTGLIIT